MQDFIKPIEANNKPLNVATTDKWLTKDRLWNFVFWFGISTGLMLGTFAKFTLGVPKLCLIIDWSTLLGIPLTVTLANRTRFIKKDTFTNSEGRILTKKQIPTGNFIWPTILGIALTFALSDKYAGRHVISSFFLFTGLLSGFSLYFIFKNCPISILFNYKFWDIEFYYGRRSNSLNSRYNSSSSSTTRSSSINYATNPSYGGLDSNIYNKYR